MEPFKFTPKPQSDYRIEVSEIKKRSGLEEHGYRHNKVIYGFCDGFLDIIGLTSLGLNIKELPFDEAQLNLANDLAERGRTKSKIDHLHFKHTENGAGNEEAEDIAQQKFRDSNRKIRPAKNLWVLKTASKH